MNRRAGAIAVGVVAAAVSLSGVQGANAVTPHTTMAQAKIRYHKARTGERAATIHTTRAAAIDAAQAVGTARLTAGKPTPASRHTVRAAARASAAGRRTLTLARASLPAATVTGTGSATPALTLFEATENTDSITPGTRHDEWFIDHQGHTYFDPGTNDVGATVEPSIGRLTSTGAILHYRLPAGVTSVSDLAAGPGDTVWFVENAEVPVSVGAPPSPDSTATLVELTASGQVSGYKLPVPDASAIAPAPDGGLWIAGITTADATELLARSRTGAVTAYTGGGLPDGSNGPACGLTVGGDGRVWVSVSSLFRPPSNSLYAMNSTGETTSYTVGTGSLASCSLATGPDGNVWFIDASSGNLIGKITPDGTVTDYTGSGIDVEGDDTWSNNPNQRALTAGPDGALWFINNAGIGRITTVGAVTTMSLPAEYRWSTATPTSITTGSDGALWFTSVYGPIGRLTTGGTLTAYLGSGINSTTSVAAGPGRSVWFSTDDGLIGQATPTGKTSLFALPDGLAIYFSNNFATGPDGSLWFNYLNDGANSAYGYGGVGHLTLSGILTLYTIPGSAGASLWGITVDPDHGTVWFSSITSQIFSMTSSGKLTTYASTAIDQPTSLTPGPGGAIWFTNYSGDTVAKITPSGRITSYYGYGISEPGTIAAAPHKAAVWFTDEGNDSVGELTPSGAITYRNLDDPAAGPVGLAVQPDGTVWVTQGPVNATTTYAVDAVTEITPGGTVTNPYTGSLDLALPTTVATAGTSTVWVGNWFTGLVKITT
ncbi:MAG TPA: hypothetical protein VGH27_30070 [Streptosporangiaceae bacterium]